MVNTHTLIDTFRLADLNEQSSFRLANCIINTVDFMGAFEINTSLIFEDCIIEDLQIHSCWFKKGLVLKNCIIKKYIDFQMGGHNEKPIIFEGNIFIGFVNFFDCQFQNIIELKSNLFINGCNLLGNKGEGFENTFASGWMVENNVGNIDIDGVGM